MPSPSLHTDIVSEFYDNSEMLARMLEVDYFLEETAGIYAYPHWYDAEVVAGPFVKRYWAAITLKYNLKDMPDPRGAKVLLKLGCKVFYRKIKERVGVNVKSEADLGERHRPKMKLDEKWLVKIMIPIRYFDNKFNAIDGIDDIDIETIETGYNQGLEDSAIGGEE